MIAVDTSSLIAFFGGEDGRDVEGVDEALELRLAVLPPVVLTEILSDPELDSELAELILDLPTLEVLPGYWERAAALRAKVLAKRRRARLADTLIAQSCIDHEAPLVTRDTNFRHFAQDGGLVLV